MLAGMADVDPKTCVLQTLCRAELIFPAEEPKGGVGAMGTNDPQQLLRGEGDLKKSARAIVGDGSGPGEPRQLPNTLLPSLPLALPLFFPSFF